MSENKYEKEKQTVVYIVFHYEFILAFMPQCRVTTVTAAYFDYYSLSKVTAIYLSMSMKV